MRRGPIAALAALALVAAPAASQNIDFGARSQAARAVDLAARYADPGLYNYAPAQLLHWRTALGKVLNGEANANLLIIGDSTSAGQAAGAANAHCRACSWPQRLAGFLKEPSNGDAWIASAGRAYAEIPGYNPMLSIGAGLLLAPTTIGGAALMWDSSTTSTTAFTATSAWDTMDVYYIQASGNGTFTLNVDGGATLATVDTGTANGGVKKVTIAATLGTHTVNVQRTSGSTVYIVGMVPQNSSARRVTILNAGYAGVTSTTYAATNLPYSPANAIAIFQPNLVIINLGINDWRTGGGGADPVGFKANIQTLITKAKAAGADVLLQVPVPSWVNTAPVAYQAQYAAALYDLARSNNVPLLDLTNRFTDYATANGAGLMSDSLHPNGRGQFDIARATATLIDR